jgi:hypothetical protein
MGFLPAAYVPGMVFHQTARWDVVRMIKLNVPWDPGHLELTPPSQEYADLVVPAFQQASAARDRRRLAVPNQLLDGLTPLEIEFFQHVCSESTPAAGAALAGEALHLVLGGTLLVSGRQVAAGDFVGVAALLNYGPAAPATAGEQAHVLSLGRDGLAQLSEQHPRLALKLYQNLVAQRDA